MNPSSEPRKAGADGGPARKTQPDRFASPRLLAPKAGAAPKAPPVSWADKAKQSAPATPKSSITVESGPKQQQTGNSAPKSSVYPKPTPVNRPASSSSAAQQPRPKKRPLNKPSKDPVSLIDIIQASKTKGFPQPQLSTPAAQARPSSQPVKGGNGSIVVTSKASGQIVQRRGKEREEVRPKRPTKLKQVILEEREEQFRELKSSLGENADQDLDQRLEAHRAKLLRGGVKLALRTDKQRQLERLKTVPKVPKQSASTAVEVHRAQQREYCRQLLTVDLDQKVFDLLSQLSVYQDRLRATNPLKAKMRRRLIVGLREVTRAVNLGKAKCVIMAPNIEDITSPNGLNDRISRLAQTAREKRIPFIYALTLKKIGQALNRTLSMSVVAVINADGAHDKLQAVLSTAKRTQLLSAIQYKKQQQQLIQAFPFQAIGFSLVDRGLRDGGAEPLCEIRSPVATVNLASLPPVKQLAVRVDTLPARVGSVAVIMKQIDPTNAANVIAIAVGHIMELPPYIVEFRGGVIESPSDSAFRTWRPKEGQYEISATIYSEYNCKGTIMSSFRATVVFQNAPEAADEANYESSTEEDDDYESGQESSGSDSEEHHPDEDSSSEATPKSPENDATGGAAVSDAPLPLEPEPHHLHANVPPKFSSSPFGQEASLSDCIAEDAAADATPPNPTVMQLGQRSRGREIDADDIEEIERIRAEKRLKRLPMPFPTDDDEGPLPDYFESSLSLLLEDPSNQRILKSPSSFLISETPTAGASENGSTSWTLFFKSPNETMRVLILDGILPTMIVDELKELISSRVKERPARSMRLYFYSTLALRENVRLCDVPHLGNYSTLLLMRKGQNVSETLAAM